MFYGKKWTEDIENKFKDHDREDPLSLHIAKTLLNDGTSEVPGVKKRFMESQQNYQRVIDLVGAGKTQQALEEAVDASQAGRGHPIFDDIIRDLKGD